MNVTIIPARGGSKRIPDKNIKPFCGKPIIARFSKNRSYRKGMRRGSPLALPVIIPRYLAQDIDTPEDWETAEVMYEVAKKRGLLSDRNNLEDQQSAICDVKSVAFIQKEIKEKRN